MPTELLVVEDDELLRRGIGLALRKEGYLVREAGSLEEARRAWHERLRLVILDLNLPDGDGRELLSQFRAGGVPVIVLTARDGEEDEVKSFDLGCDDYVTKPFSTVLLRRRIAAVLRRAGKGNRNVYCHGELVYRFSEKELLRNGQSVKLTGTERRLLEVFLRHRNQVLTREALLKQVWDAYENYVDERTLKVNISRLREKVEKDARNPEYICTVFGIGYKWSDGYE